MPHRPLVQSTWARIIAGLLFCLSGAFATLLLLIGAPSFWYFLCAVLWGISGIVWLFRPSLAASLSVFPVLGIAVLMVPYLRHFRESDPSYRALLVCVAIALALIVTYQWTGPRQLMPFAVSFGLVLIAFSIDRLWTNKVAVHEYSMNWSANGIAPWGHVETNEKGESPAVIYRRVDGGYCYDAIFSRELREKLAQANKPIISVEYNVFSDFGHQRSYNIRSIDGVVFNEGQRNLRPGESYGGYIEIGTSRSVDCRR